MIYSRKTEVFCSLPRGVFIGRGAPGSEGRRVWGCVTRARENTGYVVYVPEAKEKKNDLPKTTVSLGRAHNR